MASLVRPLNNPVKYSDQFDYPLTLDELWFWQIGTRYSKPRLRRLYTPTHNSIFINHKSYYFLPGRRRLVALRYQREQASQSKWAIARSVAQSLSRIPTIEAVFVTGALAMNNCPPHDDIDLMLVTRPHTLWLTRLLVYLLLDGRRRPPRLPEHSSPRVADKICDNLYLESSHLFINHNSSFINQNVYIAHEILQATCIFDRSDIAHQFLVQNAWVGEYLPIAYSESLKRFTNLKLQNLKLISNLKFKILNYMVMPLNFLAFLAQYLYMKPKITYERISLHSAFFHPRSSPQ